MKLLQKTKFSAIKGANIKPQLQQQLTVTSSKTTITSNNLTQEEKKSSKFRFINRPEIPLTAAK